MWDLNPRSLGYEPSEMTTSPIRVNLAPGAGIEPATDVTLIYALTVRSLTARPPWNNSCPGRTRGPHPAAPFILVNH
jgi:hypothetical protein